MSTLSLLIFAAIGAVLGYIQAEWNDSPAGREAAARRRNAKRNPRIPYYDEIAAKELYKQIEKEAYRKYLGMYGQYSKRREYIRKRWEKEGPFAKM